jgi:hypothetical protein
MSKYSSKGVGSYGNCNDSTYNKHRSNGSHSRSESPDNWSPSRSVYANKSSYSRRSKEKERERDNKFYEISNKSKKSISCRSSRSPVSHESKQSYNKSVNNYSRNSSDNHDISNDSKSSNSSSKRMHIGEWTEHISSSGKRYYYNCRTEVSQWEKPKEWLEWEKKNSNKSDRHSSHSFRDNKTDKSCVSSANIGNSSKSYAHDCSSSAVKDKDNSRTKISATTSSGSNSNISNSSIRSHSKRDDEYKTPIDRSNDDSKRHQQNDSRNNLNCVRRELVESPIGSSNESSITNACNKSNSVNNSNNNNNSNDKIRTVTNSTNISNNNTLSNSNITIACSALSSTNAQTLQSLSPSQTSNLPKLLSQLSTQGLSLPDLTAEETLRALHQALQLTKKVKDIQVKTATQNIQQLSRHSISSSPRNASVIGGSSESPISTSGHHRHHHHMHHNQHHSHYHQQQHHQSADGIRQELDLLISRGHINKSPVSEKSAISSTRHESPPNSVTNISSAISSAALKPSVPTLTPSLANYFREDLITHVTGWQADHAERQANRYSDESHNIGSHQCTRVSAELKMARSLVRLTEIQSTLQEQRILFATQQIKAVEEWKGQNASHSSYHS